MYKTNDMKLSQFRFRLPEEQIAQFPASYRDDSRLLVLHRKTGTIEHHLVRDTANFFDDGDLFVFNDTKVFPARLFGKKEKTNAVIEVFLLRELNHTNRYWDVLVDPARKIRIGNKINFDDDPSIVAEVIDNTTSRGRTFRFLTDYDETEFIPRLYALGVPPLPKYIRRPMDEETLAKYTEIFGDQPVKEMDEERYQTVFASKIGAVAAPAASLHFSKQLLKRMEIRGVETAFLTSHMSLGNFKPIDVEDLTKTKMDSEQMIIGKECCDLVNKTKLAGHHVCAIGTSVVKATESAVGTDGMLKEFDGWTNKFIFPPYDFGLADCMVANFYHPESPLMMSTAAFGGYDLVYSCYKKAVKNGYMFGCFGDSLLILND